MRKELLRRFRCHGITERLRYYLRRRNGTKVRLQSVDLEFMVNPEDIILDCGANVGDVTSKFACSGATIYAFEPNRRCFDILKKRFAFMPNVFLLNNGVMDKDCVLSLSTPDPHASFDSIETTVASTFNEEMLQSSDYTVKRDEVECIDIDKFIRQLGKRVLLMKVDIEGGEIEVLNRLMDTGGINLVDHLVVETHERLSPRLEIATQSLRARIAELGLSSKICLDWD
ncbi:FkbM family methyltransferase [Novipirellula sp. SH528]|uniref:FkbM family methyltransferase n=1 Tax=Novipirellula sp. SH528 TaxID=3454466 RepID=UPI003FA05304